MTEGHYTFGDNQQASERLRQLAALYEPETRELLQRGGVHSPLLAVDLGCGPGWSTRLVRDVLRPARTVGLDSSAGYVMEAGNYPDAGMEFIVHDVLSAPFPVPPPNVLFCRFLLTHLRAVNQVLDAWAEWAAPGALLFIHETETLQTENRHLRRYYDLVAEMQRHYGQTLLVGAVLESSFANTGWRLNESRRVPLEKSARAMANLHLANLRTWRHDDYASAHFDPNEISSLEASLRSIAQGEKDAGVVVNIARQIIAQRE